LTLEIKQNDMNGLKKLRSNYLNDEKVQARMQDAFLCFNTWQNNAYLSPEQLMKMESDMIFYVTLAIVTDVFEREK